MRTSLTSAPLRLLIVLLAGVLSLSAIPAAQAQPAVPADSATVTSADSLWLVEMQSVVVTATKTEKSLENVTVPTSVISGADIKARGSLRLSDLLREETSFQFDYSHGTGVQIQGLDPEYTLLLVDGEPMVGRTAGTLDLDRVSVSNVERVEVVRGPSSSLYGSEALAGVINIITGEPQEARSLRVDGRLGRYTTADLNATGEFVAFLDVRCECSKELVGPLSCFVVWQAVFSTPVDLECVVAPNRESVVVVNLPFEHSKTV